MRVEEVGVDQRNLQQRLDDVTDGAVIRETDLFRCGDEVPQTAMMRRYNATMTIFLGVLAT